MLLAAIDKSWWSQDYKDIPGILKSVDINLYIRNDGKVWTDMNNFVN